MKYILVLIVLILVLPTKSEAELGEAFEFALIGDLPYGVGIGERDPASSSLIEQLNHETNLAWVVHVGDIKTGGSSCSNAMFEDRKKRFKKINVPFVFTPGDNEWTDCHRLTAGAYDPLERLESLREIFFIGPWADQTKQQLDIARQADKNKKHSEFIENYSWQKNNVHFATMHIVGSKNGKDAFSALSSAERTSAHDKEVRRRERAALDWLDYVFAKARKDKAKALFLIIHANPGLDERWKKENKASFRFFNRSLDTHLSNFDKPVILAHGDSHYARIDNPSLVGKKKQKQFLRLESFGENNNAWIKVSVDPDSKNVFSFAFFDQFSSAESDE